MEHLACFYPGLLALGLMNDLHPEQRSLAEGLTQACYTAYNSTTSGLAADSFLFNTSPNGKSDYARASVCINTVLLLKIWHKLIIIMLEICRDKYLFQLRAHSTTIYV